MLLTGLIKLRYSTIDVCIGYILEYIPNKTN